MEGVLLQYRQSCAEIVGESRILFGQTLRGTDKGFGRQQRPFQTRTLLTMSRGLAGRQAPRLNSSRDSFTTSINSTLRFSATRRRSTPTSDSCSSTDSSSADSRIWPNVFIGLK